MGKIVCLVRNYRAHAAEGGASVPPTPTFFLKPATAILHEGGTVEVSETEDLQAEAELAVVIGTSARRVPPEDAEQAVAGYCAFLDMTARDVQRAAMEAGLPWTLAKGRDTFAPISAMRPRAEVGDPHRLTLTLEVNGATVQRASTGQMVHRIPDLLAAISAHMTLAPGDLVATGTPAGVPQVHPGDVLRATVERVGSVEVRVAKPARRAG